MHVERLPGIKHADEAAWRAIEPPDFPFFDLGFLRALERSGSVSGASGWEPVYLVCRDGGRLLGALPLYLKTDSYGEYVFDWEWARAYRDHGLPYYPKLVAAVPFTPATGPKLLVHLDAGEAERAAVTHALLVMARDEPTRRPVAGALFFFKGRSLYGRYWGAAEERRNLHFELCYYQGIEFAIERRLDLFEAGAQGEHKLARGFLPTLTYSAHEIRHPEFRRAIEQYIAQEKELLAGTLAEYARHDPYRG